MNSWWIIVWLAVWWIIIGGVAVAVARLLFRGRNRGAGYWVTVVVLAVAVNLLSTYVLSRLELTDPDTRIQQLVEKLDPTAAAEIRRLLEEVSKSRIDSGEARARIRYTISQVLNKHAPKAGDTEVLALVRLAIDQGELLRANPVACYQFLNPRPGQFTDYAKMFDNKMLEREQTVIEAALRSVDNSRPVPKQADVQASFEVLGERLQKRGIRLDVGGSNPKTEPAEVCNTTISVYREIFALPVEQQAPLIRFLLTPE